MDSSQRFADFNSWTLRIHQRRSLCFGKKFLTKNGFLNFMHFDFKLSFWGVSISSLLGRYTLASIPYSFHTDQPEDQLQPPTYIFLFLLTPILKFIWIFSFCGFRSFGVFQWEHSLKQFFLSALRPCGKY